MRPGEYALSKGMTVGELVRFAGGFKRNAYREDAELTSYVVQNGQKVLLDRKMVAVGKAADGDRSADQPLKPYDELQVRQLAGLSQIGAGIVLTGEVVHPGRFTLREGERLSSVIQRAGGFSAEAYPGGAVLQRAEIRQLQERSRAELVRRIETESANTRFAPSVSAKDDDQAGLMRAMQQQQQQVVENLKTQPASGRLVITISADLAKWANTNADVALRNGDVIAIPKRPDYVVVHGQVYNPTAVSFTLGRNAGWYLQRAGGPTDLANKKAIFVVRVNGSVVADKGKWLSTRVQPGDAIVVPEKVIGGSNTWKYLVNIAQITTAVALATSVATR
jgi:protein involved in polysaccharide export with SLBB domain